MHSLILCPGSLMLMISEILTMVEILLWHNDIWPSPDEIAKWQHTQGGIHQLEDRDTMFRFVFHDKSAVKEPSFFLKHEQEGIVYSWQVGEQESF